jgi:hypothetical protein
MPILKIPRHEIFAQEFAKGKAATEAMALADYADPRNSTRLTKKDEIRDRVQELQHRGAAREEPKCGPWLSTNQAGGSPASETS